MLSVNQVFHLEIAKLMQKVTLGAIPIPFIDTFKSQMRTSAMVTRSSSNYFQPCTKSQKCKQSISYTGPCIWNKVPSDIKVFPDKSSCDSNIDVFKNSKLTIERFKNQMKKFALNNITFI